MRMNHLNGMNNNENPGCSIVVATYNLLPYLKRTIQSLLELNHDPFEIIIVNDGSSDGTRQYLDSLNDSRIKVIHNELNIGTCKSRNKGIAAARYEYLAFTDHDCIVDTNWVTELIKSFKNQNTAFVIGAVYYIEKGYNGYFPERLVRNEDSYWPMGCSMAFRKSMLDIVGGFDSQMFEFGNEDTELALRCISKGYEYERNPNAVVYHQKINWTPKSLLRSAKYASVWPVLRKKYPELYTHFKSKLIKGRFISPQDYAYIVLMPILVPLLLLRYVIHGKRDIKIFFTKWPVYYFVRRYHIYKQAIKNRVLMI